MSKTVEAVMQLSTIAAVAVGSLLWIQANTVSAMDFARYQNTSDQSLILLQLTDRRVELGELRAIENPSNYEKRTIEELKYEMELLRSNLKNLQEKKY